jgi:hypothetical protein
VGGTLTSVFLGLVLILLLVAAIIFGIHLLRRSKAAPQINIHASIEQMRSIGRLSTFKVITKEIVTETDHSWGTFGSKYLRWVLSGKKMAMIFEFAIDFRYDLRSSEFKITETGLGSYRICMPPCRHEVQIRDIQFYDEQRSKLLPWLLPDLLNGFLLDGFSDEHRNRLVIAAKQHAEKQARELITSFESEVQSSAKSTLRSLGKAFGAEHLDFEFAQTGSPDVSVAYTDQLAG